MGVTHPAAPVKARKQGFLRKTYRKFAPLCPRLQCPARQSGAT
jgi:hypothetical protein